jgi:hypothetical protein
MSKIRTKKPDEKAEELLFMLLTRKDPAKIIDYLLKDIEQIRFKHEDDRVWWALVKQNWDELLNLDTWNETK